MSDDGKARRFFGGLLMAIGGLITVLCGACTGVFQIIFISGGNTGHEMSLPLYTPIMLGGLPIVIGLVLFFLGRRLLRRPPGLTNVA